MCLRAVSLSIYCWTKSYNFVVDPKADLISVWKKVHAMKWLFIYGRDLVVCYVVFHLFYNDFHVDAE